MIVECKIPKMKGEEMLSTTKQLLKVREELDEAIQASVERYIEELGDFLHAVMILIRVMRREGINTQRAIERAVEKNRRRGYYDENDSN
ncbi:MAG: hypothetical protein H0Z38_09660 [Firmicutes bacterium]|nr:hypothetical protein [Bacillota bacterium]